MGEWSFDIASAPRGHTKTMQRAGKGDEIQEIEVFVSDPVIIATPSGVVTKSRWLPEEGRWEGLTKAQAPVAWQPWPTHPNA